MSCSNQCSITGAILPVRFPLSLSGLLYVLDHITIIKCVECVVKENISFLSVAVGCFSVTELSKRWPKCEPS